MFERREDALPRMRGDWDQRATEDHKLHIATGHSGSEEAFRASGEQDLDEIVLDGVVLERSAEVLEIGCGVGRLLVPLARRVAVAHGVDISPVMVEKSKTYVADAPNVRIALTDGTFAYLADASLDFVFSFIVFQHIPDRKPIRRYVEEAARVLKPGGVFRFQVDGRWWWKHSEDGPDTYQGVKLSPRKARALLARTPFMIVDEWGAEGHYHWITAYKIGAGAAALARPRGWDLSLLASMLRRLGSTRPETDATKIQRAKKSLRPNLLDLERRLSASDPGTFVLEAYRALLGSTADETGRAFHLSILEKGVADRAALLDTIATSRGFLELYRPFVHEVPWFAAYEILMRLGEAPRRADFFELVKAITSRLERHPFEDMVAFAFKAILGYEPDEGALHHHRSIVQDHPDGCWLLVRGLLSSREDPAPPDPKAPHVALLPGESVPGEAALAMSVLEEGRGVDDRPFVPLAYQRVLRRTADSEGAAFYFGKLAQGELSRPAFLRELLWSEEGRATAPSSR